MNEPVLKIVPPSGNTAPILATLARRKITRKYGLTIPHAKLIAEFQGYGERCG